jgi:hypothetical protein
MSLYMTPVFHWRGTTHGLRRMGQRSGHFWRLLWSDTKEEQDRVAKRLRVKPERLLGGRLLITDREAEDVRRMGVVICERER